MTRNQKHCVRKLILSWYLVEHYIIWNALQPADLGNLICCTTVMCELERVLQGYSPRKMSKNSQRALRNDILFSPTVTNYEWRVLIVSNSLLQFHFFCFYSKINSNLLEQSVAHFFKQILQSSRNFFYVTFLVNWHW